MKFRDLNPGDTFDFISPDRMLNSFFQRCTKTSARGYRSMLGVEYKVGTINAKVYNVERASMSRVSELEVQTVALWLNLGTIREVSRGEENTYYVDSFDKEFFCKNYPR